MQAKAATERSAAAAQAEAAEAKQQLAELQAAPSGEGVDSAVSRLLQLIYFAMVISSCALQHFPSVALGWISCGNVCGRSMQFAGS